jgi:hypothetical protein
VAERQETAQAVTHDLADDRLTRAVLASFEQSTSDRFRTVLQSLVRHPHAFVREVELTEQEWARGIDFLTRTGQIINHRRPAGVQGTPFWTAAYDLVLAPSTSDAQR